MAENRVIFGVSRFRDKPDFHFFEIHVYITKQSYCMGVKKNRVSKKNIPFFQARPKNHVFFHFFSLFGAFFHFFFIFCQKLVDFFRFFIFFSLFFHFFFVFFIFFWSIFLRNRSFFHFSSILIPKRKKTVLKNGRSSTIFTLFSTHLVQFLQFKLFPAKLSLKNITKNHKLIVKKTL